MTRRLLPVVSAGCGMHQAFSFRPAGAAWRLKLKNPEAYVTPRLDADASGM
jgi:hypothetical protein